MVPDFINLTMLWGMAAIVAPILLHFSMKQKPQIIRFPAIRFIEEAVRKSSSAFKLRHLLLLILRILIIALFALMLSRPLMKSSFFRGLTESLSVVLIFDNSYSMSYREKDVSRMDHAKQLGHALLDKLQKEATNTRVALMFTSDPETGFSIDFNGLHKRLEEEKFGYNARSTSEVLGTAMEVLKKQKVKSQEIYIISDFDEDNWLSAPPKDFYEPKTPIYLVDVGTENARNVFVKSLHQPSGNTINVNSDMKIICDVESNAKADGLEAFLYIGNEKVDAKKLSPIEANTSTSVEFTHTFSKPEIAQGSIQIKDPFNTVPEDNVAYFTVEVREAMKVLLVSNDRRALNGQALKDNIAFLTQQALSPSEARFKSFDSELIAPDVLTDKNPRDYRAIFLIGAERLNEAQCKYLSNYVTEGGGLFIFGTKDVSQKLFGSEAVILFPWKVTGVKKAEPGTKLRLNLVGHPLVGRYKSDRAGNISDPNFEQFINVEDAPDNQILLSFTNGKPALLENIVGNGKILFLACSPDPEWSELPAYPVWVTLHLESVNYFTGLRSEQTSFRVGNVVPIKVFSEEVGDTINFTIPEPGTQGITTSYTITPEGTSKDKKEEDKKAEEDKKEDAPKAEEPSTKPAKKEAPQLIFPYKNTKNPGNYRATIKKTKRDLGFSINLQPKESSLKRNRLEAPQEQNPVTQWMQKDPLVKIIKTKVELDNTRAEAQEGSEVYLWLMGLLLMLMTLESFLSNRFYTE